MASDLMKEEFEWQSGKVDKVTLPLCHFVILLFDIRRILPL